MTIISVRKFLVGSFAAVAISAVMFLGTDGQAVEGVTTPASPNPITIYTQDTAAFRPGGLAEQLVQKARQQGEVRVIVGLRLVMRMEHTLSPEQVIQQRASLRRVQDAVAVRVLGLASHPAIVRFEFIPAMSLFVNATQLERLLADPQVVSIEEDVPMHPLLTDSIPLIHAPQVWAKGANGTGYVVAILDTGVDKTHPMLAGKVKSEACYSTTDAAKSSVSVCPGGVAISTAPGSGVNCPVVIEGCKHGTHVASIAAGNSNVRDGVAHDSDVIAVQVFSRRTSAAACGGPPPCILYWNTDLIRGLQRVYALRTSFKIAAVNMSLGGGLYAANCDAAVPMLTTAINNLRSFGIAPVIASGNDGSTGKITIPACTSSAIAVGNTTKTDLIASTSNHSSLVKLMAPGTNIVAAVPGGGYAAMSGTSMASPHVAGSFPVLKQAKPKATVNDILNALICSGKTVHERQTAGNPTELLPDRPRIDLLGAYDYLLKPPAPRTWSFDSANEARDWTPLRGIWSVAGGFYRPAPLPHMLASTVSNCGSDFDISARMRRVSANPGYPEKNIAGVVFKADINYRTDRPYPENRKRINGYFAYFSWYPLGPPFNTNGFAVIRRLFQYAVDGNGMGGDEGALDDLSGCDTKYLNINVNGFNTVRVVSAGTLNKFYLNGTLICSVRDTDHTPAYPSAGEAGVATQFDNTTAGDTFVVDSMTIKTTAPAAADEISDIMDPAAYEPGGPRSGVPSRDGIAASR